MVELESPAISTFPCQRWRFALSILSLLSHGGTKVPANIIPKLPTMLSSCGAFSQWPAAVFLSQRILANHGVGELLTLRRELMRLFKRRRLVKSAWSLLSPVLEHMEAPDGVKNSSSSSNDFDVVSSCRTLAWTSLKTTTEWPIALRLLRELHLLRVKQGLLVLAKFFQPYLGAFEDLLGNIYGLGWS